MVRARKKPAPPANQREVPGLGARQNSSGQNEPVVWAHLINQSRQIETPKASCIPAQQRLGFMFPKPIQSAKGAAHTSPGQRPGFKPPQNPSRAPKARLILTWHEAGRWPERVQFFRGLRLLLGVSLCTAMRRFDRRLRSRGSQRVHPKSSKRTQNPRVVPCETAFFNSPAG